MLLLAFGLVAIALTLAAYGVALRHPRAARGVAAVLCLALLMRCVFAARADWEWALFPWSGYAYVQGFVLYALAGPFFGIAAATLPVRWNRRVVLAVGFGVLAHGLHRHAWIAWPESHGDERVAGDDHHVRQSTHYTCGPAACAAGLSHYGIKVSERELAAACLTRSSGTSLFDLYRGLVVVLGDRPFVVSIEDRAIDELANTPIVAIGSNAGGGHALCLANTGHRLVLHDPLLAHGEVVSRETLRERFRGPAILIRRNPEASAAAAASPLR